MSLDCSDTGNVPRCEKLLERLPGLRRRHPRDRSISAAPDYKPAAETWTGGPHRLPQSLLAAPAPDRDPRSPRLVRGAVPSSNSGLNWSHQPSSFLSSKLPGNWPCYNAVDTAPVRKVPDDVPRIAFPAGYCPGILNLERLPGTHHRAGRSRSSTARRLG